MADDKKKSIGGLWAKNDFFSGSIEIGGKTIRIVCFKNGYKKDGDNAPNYRIFESDPYDPSKSGKSSSSEPKLKPSNKREASEESVSDDDIPF